MYRHVIVPIDCSDDARREAVRVARYLSPMHGTKVTIIAGITPTLDPAVHEKKVQHAQDALDAIAAIMTQYGIRTHQRILAGVDAAQALVAEACSAEQQYDLFVLGVHSIQPDIDEFETYDKAGVYLNRGSFADQLIQKSHLPVMVLPGRA